MARAIRNPSLFGEDLETVAIEAGGLALSSFVNDKLAAPFYRQLVAVQGDALGKAADAFGTALSAWLTGEGTGMVLGHRVGRLVRRGGMILAAGKALSIVLPGFSISGSLPSGLSLPQLNLGGKAQAQLPAGQQAASTNGTLTRLGVGSMGL